jgi:hypothetical protein
MLSLSKDFVVLLLAFDVGNSIIIWRLGLKETYSNTKIGNECCTLAWVEIWNTYNFSTSLRTRGDPSSLTNGTKDFSSWTNCRLEPWSTTGKFPDLEEDVEVEVESYYECSNATIRSPNFGHIKVWVLGGARVTSLYENIILFVDVGLGPIVRLRSQELASQEFLQLFGLFEFLHLKLFPPSSFSQIDFFTCTAHVLICGIFLISLVLVLENQIPS